MASNIFEGARRIAKIVAVICLTLVLIQLSVMYTSVLATETIYECSGEFTNKTDKSIEPAKLTLRYTRYRSIVSLWSDSDGMIEGEFRPPRPSVLYLATKIVGDQVQIWNDPYKFTEIKGYLNTLNRIVELHTYPGFYYGECVETDR